MLKPIIAGRDEAVAGSAERTPSVRWALASLSLSMLLSSLGTSIANVGLADAGAGVRRLLPGGPVDRPRLSPRHHHPDRQRRTARRHHRPPAAAAGRNRPVHGGLGPVRRRAHALAADRRPGGAGPRRGHHDGAHHGVRRRDGSEGEDRQRHGAARNDVRDRHRARSVARRRPDRRTRLAGDLPRQRAAGHPDAFFSRIATCPPIAGRRRPIGPASTSWARCCWR